MTLCGILLRDRGPVCFPALLDIPRSPGVARLFKPRQRRFVLIGSVVVPEVLLEVADEAALERVFLLGACCSLWY